MMKSQEHIVDFWYIKDSALDYFSVESSSIVSEGTVKSGNGRMEVRKEREVAERMFTSASTSASSSRTYQSTSFYL